jgi:hypothetical protein
MQCLVALLLGTDGVNEDDDDNGISPIAVVAVIGVGLVCSPFHSCVQGPHVDRSNSKTSKRTTPILYCVRPVQDGTQRQQTLSPWAVGFIPFRFRCRSVPVPLVPHSLVVWL